MPQDRISYVGPPRGLALLTQALEAEGVACEVLGSDPSQERRSIAGDVIAGGGGLVVASVGVFYGSMLKGAGDELGREIVRRQLERLRQKSEGLFRAELHEMSSDADAT